MGVAVALRALRWSNTTALFNDGPVFLALAEALAAGDATAVLSHEFHPLYPAVIALMHAALAPLGIGWETAALCTSLLASAGAVWALHTFVRSAFGPREAALAAALLALHGAAIDVGGDVQSEPLYLALFLAAAAALWAALETASSPKALLAGLVTGLAYLTRPEALSLLLVAGGLGIGLVVTGRWSRRSCLGFGVALGLGAGCGVLPYVGALYAETGELWITRKKSVGWVTGATEAPAHFLDGPTVPDWDRGASPSGMEVRPRRPLPEGEPAPEPVPHQGTWRRARSALSDLMHSSFRAVRYEMLPLLLIGMWAVRGPPGLRAAFVGATVGVHLLLLFALALNVGYTSTRHLLAPASLLLGYAACGVAPVARGAARLLGRQVQFAAVAALLLLPLGVLAVSRSTAPVRADERAERDAAEWLRESDAKRGPVAARKRRVAYYADAPFVKLRAKPAPLMGDYLSAYGVAYVIVTETAIAEYPGLAQLIGGPLEPLHRAEGAGETAFVLRVHLDALDAVPRPAPPQ